MLHKIFITFIIAAIAISTLFNTGGVSEKANSSGDVLAASKDTLSPVDISIKKASETAAEFPDLAMSHVNLAAAILAKVRETGDYSLNRKAEDSIKKAWELTPKTLPRRFCRHKFTCPSTSFAKGSIWRKSC